MLRSRLTATLLLIIGLASAQAGTAQLPVEEWTERPDARGPAGISDDRLLAEGGLEILYNLRVMSFENILAGTDEIPAQLVLSGAPPNWPAFASVPLTMSKQVHELELRVGIFDWLGGSIRVPYISTSAEFATEQLIGSPSQSGIGDVELSLHYGLHDIWPYRAHISAGLALPTGSTDAIGRLPDQPLQDRILPYPMQTGDGTVAILPAATFIAENEAGTVGLRANARIPFGENDREWTRGSVVEGHIWMAYRFTDWVSGSARLTFRKTGNIEGFDPEVNRFSTPSANPGLQGGTRVELPIGINIRFAEGPLARNQLRAEFILPVHQNLDGPQIKAKYGAALSWGVRVF